MAEKSGEFSVPNQSQWTMPADVEKALEFILKLEVGFEKREDFQVWKTEPDRALVTDTEHGAYTVFAVYNNDDKSVRIYEEEGWPL